MTDCLPDLRLSEAMREGSRLDHEAAEGALFVRDVMTGRVAPSTYADYIERLHGVYSTLEQIVHHHRHEPTLASVYDDRLLRLAALDADLSHWRGRHPRSRSMSSPATAAYVARIHAVEERPELLVAHHYTRYLGDLSGGRILERRLRDRFGGDGGLAFYRFARIDRPAAYKRAYRDRLDALPLSAEQREDVVAEVRAAFRLNHALLEEL